MKIKGFLEDISGIKRITKARLEQIKNAPDGPIPEDPIRKIAEAWHPGELSLEVSEVRAAGEGAKLFRFRKPDGTKLPLFLPGQYLVLTAEPDGKPVSRPYSICSSPAEAYREDGFVEICIKKPRKDGFFADWVLRNLKAGDRVFAVIGCGQFTYEPLRDAPRMLGLAGGAGITPFVSMAREIAAGKAEFSLTILYGANSPEELILYPELEALAREAPEKLRVIPVIAETASLDSGSGSDTGPSSEKGGPEAPTGSEAAGDTGDFFFEKGFISAELIRKYLQDSDGNFPDTSLFICGPQAMYRYLGEELAKLSIPKRRIRFEVFGQAKNIAQFDGYPAHAIGKTFRMTVHRGIREDCIPARADESIAVSLERAGIRLETGCRSGECGFCRTKVLEGSFFVCPENDGRRAADRDFNYVHACAAYPLSDLAIRIPIA